MVSTAAQEDVPVLADGVVVGPVVLFLTIKGFENLAQGGDN